MDFSYDTQYLVSIGTHENNTVALWDLLRGRVVRHDNLGE